MYAIIEDGGKQYKVEPGKNVCVEVRELSEGQETLEFDRVLFYRDDETTLVGQPVVAGAKGESDISIGNVVGSNVFNICMVIGTVGLFNPMTVDMGAVQIKFAAMIGISLLLFVFCRTGYRVNRFEGACLFFGFILFIILSYWV